MLIDPPPGEPEPTGQAPDGKPCPGAQDLGASLTREQLEPTSAPAPLPDTFVKLVASVLGDPLRVSHLLRIYVYVMGSVIILLAILVMVVVIAPDAHVWIKFGGAVLGVAGSGGVFAYARRRKLRKPTETGQHKQQGNVKKKRKK